MINNPYDSPDFATQYVAAERDFTRNRYEWSVTLQALMQCMGEPGSKMIDYGCGSGIFTAVMRHLGDVEAVGTDASAEMLGYAQKLGKIASNLTFQQWDAISADSSLQSGAADRIFAKLVFNYIPNHDLSQSVLPRLRGCLADDGLLVAVLPNPLREVKYSQSEYEGADEIDITVGSFGEGVQATAQHHTFEDMIKAADNAGFGLATVLGLPDVRFEKYKKFPWSKPQLMKIAHPFPMLFDTLNAAKRWVYVFGATPKAEAAFDRVVGRFISWREYHFPEIADQAHMITPQESHDEDIVLPLQAVGRQTKYVYRSADSVNRGVFVPEGTYVENLNAKQKLTFIRQLARAGIREATPLEAHLVAA